MQTLISVFDDRSDARKAVDRLVRDGFSRDAVQLHEGVQGSEPSAQEVADEDRSVLDSLGHFLVSLFGQDRGERAAGEYGDHMKRGNSVVIVDAQNDEEAEHAAVVLHDSGAIDVDDRDTAGGTPVHRGVRVYEREGA